MRPRSSTLCAGFHTPVILRYDSKADWSPVGWSNADDPKVNSMMTFQVRTTNRSGGRRTRHQRQIRRCAASFIPVVLINLLAGFQSEALAADSATTLNIDRYDPASGIAISQQDSRIVIAWPIDSERRGRMTIDLLDNAPLIKSIGISGRNRTPFETIVEEADPILLLRVGERDLDRRGGWTIFFDRMQEKPSDVFPARIDRSTATAASSHQRATLTVGTLTAGPFQGELRWTFYSGSPFILQEAVVHTEQDGIAFLYDTGLTYPDSAPDEMSWHDSLGNFTSVSVDEVESARNLAVHGRAICAESDAGSLALFPPPHRYFYPLDFSDNLANIWIGAEYDDHPLPFGFGIRHDSGGDNRYVPWFNAPPGTTQELGLFLLITDRSSEQTLDEVARLTRSDRFAPLPGHTVFSSHYHVEHTRELLEAQTNDTDAEDATGRLPSGGEYSIPDRLVKPGFIEVFREMGIDIVHIAEFHFGRTPRMTMDERVQHLELLHAECARLSDDQFLLLPGEEPNVHLGGHWISFFPKPVYWVLNRPEGTPFKINHPELGEIYHVGGEADVLQLLRAEGGLAWTAHPRIKGSTGFPDNYRDRVFFTSDRFLGAAWKAMPADLSQPRLGSRVLDLLDDMSNWGDPKFVLGEVDVFKIEPDHELYGHMNVNYLRLDQIPRFEDGWQPVLDALRNGQFFVTTGEVLIPEFTVNGCQSGEIAEVSETGPALVQLKLQWTFPLAYAEIISGDGNEFRRQRVDLSETGQYGEDSVDIDVDLAGQRWVRVEVWDVATNGAFTQPVWLE